MNRSNLAFRLPVVITKQGRRFVAYTPALDISTTGKSQKDAQKKFEELAHVFLEEIFAAGTASEVLSELGWKRAQQQWNPPKVVSSKSIGINIPISA